MPYQPDKSRALDICKALLDEANKQREELGTRDPEGRTLSLGVTLFMGIFMSSIKDFRDREELAHAAVGYSMITSEEILHGLRPK